MANWECQFCTNSNRKIILNTGIHDTTPNTVVFTKNSKDVINGCFITLKESDLTANRDYVFSVVAKSNLCAECLILLNSNNSKNYTNAKKYYTEKLK